MCAFHSGLGLCRWRFDGLGLRRCGGFVARIGLRRSLGGGRLVLRLNALAAQRLGKPILHRAFVLSPKTRVLRRGFAGNDAGHHVVHEGAVVTDQENRALVILQQLLQEFQCFNVQVVGGFVQHQDIGGPGKQARQQQAIALAARQ